MGSEATTECPFLPLSWGGFVGVSPLVAAAHAGVVDSSAVLRVSLRRYDGDRGLVQWRVSHKECVRALCLKENGANGTASWPEPHGQPEYAPAKKSF